MCFSKNAYPKDLIANLLLAAGGRGGISTGGDGSDGELTNWVLKTDDIHPPKTGISSVFSMNGNAPFSVRLWHIEYHSRNR